jgi:hypothetical protein
MHSSYELTNRGCGSLECMRRQAPDNDRCGALDIAVAGADADARQVADDEVDSLCVAFGLEEVREVRQHIVELPASEMVVGLVQARVAQIIGMQFVAARDRTAEFRGGLFSVRTSHRTAILEGCRVVALFVIARTGHDGSIDRRQECHRRVTIDAG